MATITEEELIERCKTLIEEKTGWGKSGNWSNRDFEELSQNIFDATEVNLSATTLKRIWGRVKYDSVPTLTTLDTLARYAGYLHWRDFRRSQIPENSKAEIETVPVPESKQRSATNRAGAAILLCVLAALAVTGYFIFFKTKKSVAAPVADYAFSSRTILNLGVPNSVVFDYDASRAPVDSVYIQQSWDRSLNARVPRNGRQHTSIYYYPGFFRARLKVGDQVVKEHDVFIQTDGWLGMIEQNPIPVYFKKEEIIRAGKMSLSAAKIKPGNILLRPELPVVNFTNVREFGGLKTGNFIFETSLKNDYSDGSNVCQPSEIRISCEGSMIAIPLSAKGCVSENNLFFLGRLIKGAENDLSGFGVDFSDFVKLRLEVLNGDARFFINDKMVYHIQSSLSSDIVGISFRFRGSGSVDYVRLKKNDGTVVYDDEFSPGGNN